MVILINVCIDSSTLQWRNKLEHADMQCERSLKCAERMQTCTRGQTLDAKSGHVKRSRRLLWTCYHYICCLRHTRHWKTPKKAIRLLAQHTCGINRMLSVLPSPPLKGKLWECLIEDHASLVLPHHDHVLHSLLLHLGLHAFTGESRVGHTPLRRNAAR